MGKGKPSFTINIDDGLKLVAVIAFFVWNFFEGAFFDHQYPLAMVSLYRFPIWRLVFVALIYIAADWCPSVAIMLGFFIFFYIMDMEVTLDKWSTTDLKRPANE
jgi:hypothetical protein